MAEESLRACVIVPKGQKGRDSMDEQATGQEVKS